MTFAGGVLASFFDGAVLVPGPAGNGGEGSWTTLEVASEGLSGGPQMRRVRVAAKGGSLRVEVAARPFERCLRESSFGGQLAASGDAVLMAPIILFADLSKTALFENTLQPDGDIVRRAFGERVRIRLGL